MASSWAVLWSHLTIFFERLTGLSFVARSACDFAIVSIVLTNVGMPSARGDEPSQERIAAWVEQLGSNEFDVRDSATSQLSKLSAEHLPALKIALTQATDPEVRVRLSGVVAKLKFERQQRVIRAFLRDPDMTNSHELEGWSSFSAVAGANRTSKRLFLELYERHPYLCDNALENGEQAAESARRVAKIIQEADINLGAGDASDGLALLYCICTANGFGNNQMNAGSLRTFQRFPYNQIFRDPQAKKPMEVMAERWALALESPSDLTSAILVMIESDLSTVRSVARKMLEVREGPNRAEPDDLLIALQVMFRFGTKDDLPTLERWLDCTEVCVESFSMIMPGGIPGMAVPPGLGGPPSRFEIPPSRSPQPPSNSDQPNRSAPSDPDPSSTHYTAEVRDAAVLACMRISGMTYRDHFPEIVLREPRGYIDRSIVNLRSAEDLRAARIAAWRDSESTSRSAQ